MSASSTAPLKRAPIGPILISTVATMRVSDSLVSDWQPGMQRLSTSGSLSAFQTSSRDAAIRCSPDIFIDRLLVDPGDASLRRCSESARTFRAYPRATGLQGACAKCRCRPRERSFRRRSPGSAFATCSGGVGLDWPAEKLGDRRPLGCRIGHAINRLPELIAARMILAIPLDV